MSPNIGLLDKDPVIIQKPKEASIGLAVRVVVAPASEADWNIVSLNQGRVERSLLSQVRVVQAGQRLRVAVDQVPIYLDIRSVDPPREAVVLQTLTELVIETPVTGDSSASASGLHQHTATDAQNIGNEFENAKKNELLKKEEAESFMNKLFSPLNAIFFGNKIGIKSNMLEDVRNMFLSSKVTKIFRVFSAPQNGSSHPYTGYIAKNSFSCLNSGSSFLAKILLLPITCDMKNRPEPVIIKIKAVDDVEDGIIKLPETLMKWQGISTFSRIFLESIPFHKSYADNIESNLEITSTQNISEDDKQEINNMIKSGDDKLCFFPLPCLLQTSKCLLEITSDNEREFVFIQSSKFSVKIIRAEKLKLRLDISSLHDPTEAEKKKNKLESTFQRCKLEDSIMYLQKLPTSNRHFNLLVTGNSGTGKTCFVQRLAAELGDGWAVKSLNCVTLKGKRVEAVTKQVEACLQELEARAPGMLILDNLDTIAPCEEEDRPDDHSKNIASWLLGVLLHHQKYFKVSIIVTAKSTFSLHDLLQSTRGSLPFRRHVSLLAPDKKEVLNLVRFYLNSESLTVSSKFLSLSEGCHPSDLRQVVDRVMTRWDEVTPERLEQEMAAYVPSAKWGQNLRPTSVVKLEDVGSLHEAKHSLVQVLLWPSQYPQLFLQCGVRTPRGVLLYGPPGTGKTLLAEAVSSHTGLNLISVRGPELLSKYIGASEGNVRDLFIKAQAARPCIVFFDEFESLAPRRGHDSTGVTDRVVNQLLTQLDGVESLDGVWVVAASSRPDLIDPALLRPGRLDRAVECPMPGPEARAEILGVLLRGVRAAADVELGLLGQLSSGMTGADLRAVVYTATLLARDNTSGQGEAGCVTQGDLVAAVTSTQPSVTGAEVAKYEAIYTRFRSGKSAHKNDIQQRATLA